MNVREYIRTHYGVCATMEQIPRSCRCMGLIQKRQMDPMTQHLCANWVSVPDKDFDDMLRRQRANLGK